MIKSLTITNNLGESIKLELMRPELSGFLVKSVDGLGPVKANINTTKMAANDGSVYNSASLDQRNIVLNLIFLDSVNESIEDLRHKSYRYFPLKKEIRFCVETDNRTSETTGYVETNEPSIFSNQEGCSISIICTDPLFYTLRPADAIFSGVEPVFEFPFSNESLSDPLLELGNMKANTEKNVYYSGDADVGITIKIHALGEASNISIYNLNSQEKMTIDTSKMIIKERRRLLEDTDITWESGKYISANSWNLGGIDSTSAIGADNLRVSGYIPVIPGTSIEYTTAIPWTAGLLFCGYDAEKNYVDGDYRECLSKGKIITGMYEIPSAVKYIRLCVNDEYNDVNLFIYTKPNYKESELFNDDEIEWEFGVEMSSDGYNVSTHEDGMVSDFIPVISGSICQYNLTGVAYSSLIANVYDSDKKLIKQITGTGTSSGSLGKDEGSFLFPSNARYIRVNCTKRSSNSLIYLKPDKKVLKSGDTVTINTSRGSKSINLQRNGQIFNIFNCVGKKTDWFTLLRGDNLFAYRAETGEENLQFRIENKVAYTGV